VRITRAILCDRVERINKALNRPATAYTKVETIGGKTYLPNDGHFKLDVNSPGDGWTRYTLATTLESGGETNVSRTFNALEMFAYLSGVMDVLDTYYTHRFDKMLPRPVKKTEHCECGRLRDACTGGHAKNRNTLHADKDGAK
jgi:hypothetical protein